MTQHLARPRSDGRVASPTPERNAVTVAIRRILMHEWDPLGIRDDPSAQAEYDADVSALYEMMEDGVPQADLEAYLARREADCGVGGGTRRARRDVVTSLIEVCRGEDPAIHSSSLEMLTGTTL